MEWEDFQGVQSENGRECEGSDMTGSQLRVVMHENGNGDAEQELAAKLHYLRGVREELGEDITSLERVLSIMRGGPPQCRIR